MAAPVLESEFVNCVGIENRSVRDLKEVLFLVAVVAGGGQRKGIKARISFGVFLPFIAPGERIVLAQLIIKPSTDLRVGGGVQNRIAVCGWIEIRVQNEGIDDCSLSDIATFQLQRERRVAIDGPVNVPS